MPTLSTNREPAGRAFFLWRAVGPIIVGFIVGLIYAIVGPNELTQEYYSAAAQIIPILMLALVVETRVLAAVFDPGPERWPRNKLDRFLMGHDGLLPFVIVSAIMFLLVLGELLALSALANAGTKTDPFTLEFILGFGVAAIATVPISRTDRSALPQNGEG